MFEFCINRKIFNFFNREENNFVYRLVCYYYVVFTILFATESFHLLAQEGAKVRIVEIRKILVLR